MSSADPYSSLVRDCFASPAHAGELDAGVSVDAGDEGGRVRLAAIEQAGSLEALRFRAWGCPHLIAACEYFCAGYEGRPVAALSDFGATDIMQKLAVPVEKTGRILVLEDAVRALSSLLSEGAGPH